MNYLWLNDRVSRTREVVDGYGFPFRWEPNPPATESQIVQCETSIAVSLPPSLRSFLRVANGVSFFIAHPYEILSTERICEVTREMRSEDYDGDDVGNLIAAVTYNGDCDRLVLEPNRLMDGEYAVLDAFHEEGPSGWRMPGSYVAPSFGQWLLQTFDTVGWRHETSDYWILPGSLFQDLVEPHRRAVEDAKRVGQDFRW